MPVSKQMISIPFTGGIDSKTDSKQVMAGKMLDLVNGQFTKQGEVRKRFGFASMGRPVSTSPDALMTFQDELLCVDTFTLYTRDTTADAWMQRGVATSAIPSSHPVVRNSAQQLYPDVGYSQGYELYVWEDSRVGLRLSQIESATGAYVAQDISLTTSATASKPKIARKTGDIKYYIFWIDGANLKVSTMTPGDPNIGAPFTLVTDVNAASGLDVTVAPSGTTFYVAYVTTAPAVKVFTTTGGAPVATATVEAVAAQAYNGGPSVVNVSTDGTTVWVAWGTGTESRVAAENALLTVVVKASTQVQATRVDALTGLPNSGPGVSLYFENHDADPTKHVIRLAAVTVGAISTFDVLLGHGIVSKVFATNSRTYLNVAHGSTLQPSYFTIDINASNNYPIVVAVTSLNNGGGLRAASGTTTGGTLSEVVSTTAGKYLWANGTRGKIISEANQVFGLVGVQGTLLDFGTPLRWRGVTQSRNLLIGGGAVQVYDGASLVEQGFFQYPEGVTLVASGADGALTAGASYQYVAVYAWTDASGQVQLSAPSVPAVVIPAATNHVAVTVPTLRLTTKQGPTISALTKTPVTIIIYRTAGNGKVFHRVTSALAPLLNSTTVNSVTFTDILADTDIAANELVYTTGDILPNAVPPSASIVTTHKGRVFLAGLEDPNLIWFSKNKFDNSNANTIPVEFADTNTIGVDAFGGPITGLATLDDKLVIFKYGAIFALSGDGPNDTGLGEIYGDPQLVTSDTGCIDPRTVLETPQGVVFQSIKGIYMLDRQLGVSYFGAPVEDLVSAATPITSAVLHARFNQMIFASPATEDSDSVLVFDYQFGQWARWSNMPVMSACIFEDLYTFLGNGINYSDIRQQSTVLWTDAGDFVGLSWVTPNLSFAGLGSFARVFRVFLLGTYKSAHQLTVEVAYDHSTSFGSAVTISPVGDLLYQYRFDFKTQRCTAVRLRVTDANGSGTKESYSVSQLDFEVAAMPGGNRLPARQAYGVG